MKDLQLCTITIGICMYKEYMCEIGSNQVKGNVRTWLTTKSQFTKRKQSCWSEEGGLIFLAFTGVSKFIIYFTRGCRYDVDVLFSVVVCCSRYILEGRFMIDGWHWSYLFPESLFKQHRWKIYNCQRLHQIVF